jgi:hypothetical protein
MAVAVAATVADGVVVERLAAPVDEPSSESVCSAVEVRSLGGGGENKWRQWWQRC